MIHDEYGGYIEFETYHGIEFHNKAMALNCGRNCLAYLIKAKNIKKIYLPYFLCSSVSSVCNKLSVPIEYYHIDIKFRPIFLKNVGDCEFLYIVNFYGQLSNEEIISYGQKYRNLIVDNTQAFFQQSVEGFDTIYTCRKYFGVPDGAYLYTQFTEEEWIEQDYSFERMHYLFGRFEQEASKFYSEYIENNRSFRDEPVKRMSKLTHNLLRAIDYKRIAKVRIDNFSNLNRRLAAINKMNLAIPNGAFMYPLYVEGGEQIRKVLQEQKIYVPTLWPDVFEKCDSTMLEWDMAANILPLPVDQRYSKVDMEYISMKILECID